MEKEARKGMRGPFRSDGRLPRRSFLKVMGAAGAMVAAGGMLPSRAEAAKTLKLGIMIKTYGGLVLSYPGIEGKHNIKHEIVSFTATAEKIPALLKGNLDAADVTAQHFIRSIDEGLGFVAVCGVLAGGVEFLVAKDLPVGYGDFAGLKKLVEKGKAEGKRLKIAAPTGSYQHLMLEWQLRKYDIDPRADVEILNVIFPDHPTVLQMKQVDMVTTVPLFGGFAVMKGFGKVFYYPYDSPAGKQNMLFVVRSETIKNDPELVQSFVSTQAEVLDRLNRDPDKGLDMDVKYSGLPPQAVKHYLDNQMYNFRIDMKDLKGMAGLMHRIGWNKKDVSGEVEKFVDFSFLEKATGLKAADLTRWDWTPKPPTS